jgi:hypothetical protein
METMNTTLKVGDKVKIVLYGQMELEPNDEGALEPRDIKPGLVGQEGVVDMIIGKNFPKYYVSGIGNKYGPYNEEQLQKI